MKRSSKHIAEITEYLYLCGIGSITGEKLQDIGITHVLNVAAELSDFKYPIDSLSCLRIPWRDNPEQHFLSGLNKCFQFILDAKNDGGKILVHCVAGASRSVSVCLAYLVKYENMNLRDAFSHIKKERDGVYPNHGFWNQLIDFERSVRGDVSVEMRPYIFGTVPELDPGEISPDIKFRLQCGWFRELVLFYGFHLFLLFLQLLILSYG